MSEPVSVQGGVASARVSGAPQAIALMRALLISMRPKQWTKNFVVFFALVFSINQYWSPSQWQGMGRMLAESGLAFGLFSLISSSVYLINDLVDIEEDRRHPRKRLRPIPSGQLAPAQARMAAYLLGGLALAASFWINRYFGLVASGYALLMITYSFLLKHVVIVDVLTIAGGFVLRAVAGAVVISVPISPWLYICTVLGALFLGFSKRRHELTLLEGRAEQHRPILREYTLGLVDQMIAVVTPSTLMAYSLYTFTAEGLPKNHAMMLTIPFVIYGLFRYLYLTHSKNEGGSPEEILLKDAPLVIDIALWVLTSAVVLFAFRGQ